MPSDSKPESRLRFFFDNNFPKKLAAALAALCPEHHLEHLTTRFKADTSDEQWLDVLAKEGGWIIVSADFDIIGPHAIKIIRGASVAAIVLKKGFANLELWEYSAKIIKLWPEIMAHSRRFRPGEIWTVTVSSLKLEMYVPPKR